MVHFQKAEQLKQQADNLLRDKCIINNLSQFANLNLTGSYTLDLMVWPDIDLQIEITDKNRDRVRVFTDLAYHFLHDRDFKKINLIHFTPGKKATMPTGMYMGMNCRHGDLDWKIDIWALDPEHQAANEKYMNQVQSALTEPTRIRILDWKHRLLKDGRVPQLGSYLLYKAILFEKLISDQEIENYLTEHGFTWS